MKEKINSTNIPQHVAVIMDGNGRWAKQRGAARLFGHKNAIKAVRETVEGCAEIGVGRLTLYAFSTENWNRPKIEVDGLMNLLVSTIKKEIPTLMKNNIRLQPLGDISHLPKEAQENLQYGIEQTGKNEGMVLSLALNYSGRWEIGESVKQLVKDLEEKKLAYDDVNNAFIGDYISKHTVPDVELMIRTSGEHRISNFLLWQMAYAELYFTDKLWPDFRKNDLFEAVIDFQNRERRYGKISEQLTN
ncbi:di-trans,poly-cis-decaprenylcistransferase [Reichenbachiella sp. 5M10]|uniref:isoprenyl transferase n=1 Tax=Reichenbachiella sp. 5M10 TaxID=1889772 RepID=UPI000C145076|nr:isoprenyl transferase [Reichenbachiella sp. 5M10]PIB37248.1 di-trans,poly-cis-decaprenylcistransferase [Reichenbachiella sp. 5M10]